MDEWKKWDRLSRQSEETEGQVEVDQTDKGEKGITGWEEHVGKASSCEQAVQYMEEPWEKQLNK